MKLRLSVGLFALVLLRGSLASAQLSEGEAKAAARAAYSEGVALQDKGNPAEALARFEAAQKNFDAPTHLLHIAECQALTGKLVEAVETYETLTHKDYKGGPDVFRQAQTQGVAELEQLRPRVPTMRVLVKPDPQTLSNLQIAVNDKQFPAELVGIARPVNPGKYRMTASATGWGTPTPTDVEVREKDAMTVALTLQKGVVVAGIAPVPAGGAPAGGDTAAPPPTTPAPYDQGAKPAPSGPSPLGLLIGVRPAVFVPSGSVTSSEKFKTIASAGPGVGLDLLGRVARVFLVGGTLEFASLGAGTPDTSKYPKGTSVDISNTSIYAGVIGGLIPNVDRVSFVGDLGVGMRFFNHTEKPDGVAGEDRSFNGLEFALNAGLSIPAGPLRIMPKVGLAFGSFSNKSCATASTNCASTATDITNTGSHVFLNAGLGLYYNLDFAKKPKATAAL